MNPRYAANPFLIAVCLFLGLLSLLLGLHIVQQENPATAVHFRGDETVLDERAYDTGHWNKGDWERFNTRFNEMAAKQGGPAPGQSQDDWMRQQWRKMGY